MTRARVVLVAILLVALATGAGLYYAQVYGYYGEVEAVDAGFVQLRTPEGREELQPFADWRAIDSDSSPIRFRACFWITRPRDELDAVAAPYPEAEPLVAPRWFDCFDAPLIGAALEAGEARAYLGVSDEGYGIDRVVAVLPSGQAWSWDQINRCGAAAFNGRVPPEGCPPAPEGLPRRSTPDET